MGTRGLLCDIEITYADGSTYVVAGERVTQSAFGRDRVSLHAPMPKTGTVVSMRVRMNDMYGEIEQGFVERNGVGSRGS